MPSLLDLFFCNGSGILANPSYAGPAYPNGNASQFVGQRLAVFAFNVNSITTTVQ